MNETVPLGSATVFFDSHVITPPCAVTHFLAIANPSPVPLAFPDV
jgi:hypothetical protein